MKKIYVAGVAALLFFTACENQGSSSVGTYENDDAPAASDEKEDNSQEQGTNKETENVNSASADTAKNTTGVIKDSMSSNNKKDTTAINKKTVKAQKTKKIDAKP